MRPYLIRRTLIILKVLKFYENIGLVDFIIALFKENKRKELLDVYRKPINALNDALMCGIIHPKLGAYLGIN